MKFCATLTFTNPDYWIELASLAESHGYDTMVLSDHLVHHETIAARYPYNESGERAWSPETPWADVWVASGMMAAVTERLNFIQSVYVLPMRDPFHVAKALGTVARLSGYRVGLGLGLGWLKEEFELLGHDFHTRGRRADEMVEVMRKLWTGELVEHHGEFYDFDRMSMSPGMRGPVPVVVGGNSRPALRRVARLADGWTPAFLGAAEIREGLATIHGFQREFGRSGHPLTVYASAPQADEPAGYRELEDAGVTHVTTVPWLERTGDPHDLSSMMDPPLQQMKDGLRRYADEVIAKL